MTATPMPLVVAKFARMYYVTCKNDTSTADLTYAATNNRPMLKGKSIK